MIDSSIRVVSEKEFEQIKKELWEGKNYSEIGYCEFVKKLKQLPSLLPIIEFVNGYGIFAYADSDGTPLFASIDMDTGVERIYGRESLKEIREDIEEGVINEIEKTCPNIYSIKHYYERLVREQNHFQKYNGFYKRFPLKDEQYVLDMGAGEHPDLRATHAIDIRPPMKKFDIDYQSGYDLESSVELPYTDNYFDSVVSYGGLAINFESLHLYNEIFRILKSGRSLEFNHGSDDTKKWLKKAGFQDIQNDEYFNEIFNQKIGVIVTTKPK